MNDKPRSGLLKPSTRAFTEEARRTPGYSFFDWLHGQAYARWPYLYIGLATREHPLARLLGPLVGLVGTIIERRDTGGEDRITHADTYHGKVVTLEAAKQLVTVDREISLTNLEQVIPYALARDLILHAPDHIVVLDCPCRAVWANPCLPLDVCLIIGEPFASFVAEHHKRRARWITPEEAIEILKAEHERGHVAHAFFNQQMLGRFYAICNCCSCCCGAMQAQREGSPMLASSGYVAALDETLCAGCGTCARYCQFGAITVEDKKGTLDQDSCMGCGVCVSHCPQQALSLRREPSKGEPLEIAVLIDAAG